MYRSFAPPGACRSEDKFWAREAPIGRSSRWRGASPERSLAERGSDTAEPCSFQLDIDECVFTLGPVDHIMLHAGRAKIRNSCDHISDRLAVLRNDLEPTI